MRIIHPPIRIPLFLPILFTQSRHKHSTPRFQCPGNPLHERNLTPNDSLHPTLALSLTVIDVLQLQPGLF